MPSPGPSKIVSPAFLEIFDVAKGSHQVYSRLQPGVLCRLNDAWKCQPSQRRPWSPWRLGRFGSGQFRIPFFGVLHRRDGITCIFIMSYVCDIAYMIQYDIIIHDYVMHDWASVWLSMIIIDHTALYSIWSYAHVFLENEWCKPFHTVPLLRPTSACNEVHHAQEHLLPHPRSIFQQQTLSGPHPR